MTLFEIFEMAILGKPLTSDWYYQEYWWLLVDRSDHVVDDVQGERPTNIVWPPFTGVRVPLGGDQA